MSEGRRLDALRRTTWPLAAAWTISIFNETPRLWELAPAGPTSTAPFE